MLAHFRIAPLWLEFCGKVRTMTHLYWNINGSIPHDIPTGDAYVKHGKVSSSLEWVDPSA